MMSRTTRPPIAQRRTLLAVGEGKSDAAFLKHLRKLYCSSGLGLTVTVRQANGKGPGNVIATAIGALRISYYDKKLCLLDTDLFWTPKNHRDAKHNKIELIGSTPCLEGMLLQILGRTVPPSNHECKGQIKAILKKDLLYPEDYESTFYFELLENARPQVPVLNQLLRLYQGHD